MGGVLVYQGSPVEYFMDEFTSSDCDVLRFDLGSSAGQQSAEALCVLVALRLWDPAWAGKRCMLSVMSDSVSALTMVVHGRAKGHGPGICAREAALDIAEQVYRPHVGAHLPGVMNTVADVLSRRFDPSKTFALHAAVSAAGPRRRGAP